MNNEHTPRLCDSNIESDIMSKPRSKKKTEPKMPKANVEVLLKTIL